MLSKSDLENVQFPLFGDCEPSHRGGKQFPFPLSSTRPLADGLSLGPPSLFSQESYLFKAALSELRTELQIHRRNDTANLRSDVNTVMREVDALHIKLREDMANLKSDIAMEMNTRKAEMRESAKKTEFGMLEANNRYTVELSDFLFSSPTPDMSASSTVLTSSMSEETSEDDHARGVRRNPTKALEVGDDGGIRPLE
ncbi:MAG: hypothetical protein BJ554DRAFT_6840 [Olpidium bornovanus]|uniref:Uncharacterized protein n=1 Tax=Olpidium bornovanus TaxID=278681 RepID=A0A8H7ZX07_9FUNG|nr:MAG: hypothetical protein BJ554DRAFT_6840 [Olpidium bornovanus]